MMEGRQGRQGRQGGKEGRRGREGKEARKEGKEGRKEGGRGGDGMGVHHSFVHLARCASMLYWAVMYPTLSYHPAQNFQHKQV